MKCEKCGYEIDNDITKCPFCGTARDNTDKTAFAVENQIDDTIEIPVIPAETKEVPIKASNTIDEETEAEIFMPDQRNSDSILSNNNSVFQNCSYCTRCGQPVHFGYTLCPKCTSYVKEEEKRREIKERNRKNNDSSTVSVVLIFLIVAVSVLLIVVSACIMILKMKSQPQFPQNYEQTSATVAESMNNTPANNSLDSTQTVNDSAYVPGATTRKVKKYSIGYPSSSNHIMTWHEAAAAAASRGGYLACPNSKEEFDAICAKADSAGLYIIWLGAERGVNQSWGSVNWYNGTPMQYTKWFSGKIDEPSYTDNGREELYLTACKRNGVWGFNDSPSDIEYAFKVSEYASRVGYILEKEE